MVPVLDFTRIRGRTDLAAAHKRDFIGGDKSFKHMRGFTQGQNIRVPILAIPSHTQPNEEIKPVKHNSELNQSFVDINSNKYLYIYIYITRFKIQEAMDEMDNQCGGGPGEKENELGISNIAVQLNTSPNEQSKSSK